MSDRIVGTEEAARMFGTSTQSIQAWARAWPAIRVSHGKYSVNQLMAYQASKTTMDERVIKKLAVQPSTTVEGAGNTPSGAVGDVGSSGVSGGAGGEDQREIARELQRLKLAKERAIAAKAETAARKEAGELVELSAAVGAFSEIAAAVKARFEAIPGHVAPDLVGRDRLEIETILETEIGKALKEFQRAAEVQNAFA